MDEQKQQAAAASNNTHQAAVLDLVQLQLLHLSLSLAETSEVEEGAACI